jgi:transcriptional regulator with PAS, ATPase and Fis domain
VQVEEKTARNWCHCGPAETGARQNPRNIVIGQSPSMGEVLNSMEIVAPTLANVLIGGETGVGKEIIARAIHAASGRNQEKFVAVNCGAIAESLIESALFGHEKGAFTGAYNVHKGFFERACTGTLFLDEIDSLSLSGQAKLLRILQEGEFERVGGRQVIKADVRIIAASNRPLKDLVTAGDFRKDLFYRLNIVPIHIPPLRDRREDIGALADYFLKQLSDKYQKPKKSLGEQAWRKVMLYDWPGNVRELENVFERAFLFTRGPIIEDIPVELNDSDSGSVSDGNLNMIKKKVAREIEIKMLQDALTRFSGNVSAVAREMEITPRAVHQKLKKHHIEAAAYRNK